MFGSEPVSSPLLVWPLQRKGRSSGRRVAKKQHGLAKFQATTVCSEEGKMRGDIGPD